MVGLEFLDIHSGVQKLFLEVRQPPDEVDVIPIGGHAIFAEADLRTAEEPLSDCFYVLVGGFHRITSFFLKS